MVAYAAAGVLSLRCARRATQIQEFRFWAVGGALLLLLGVNKQLDLQTLLTQIGRDSALSYGWYAERRGVQLFFVSALAAIGAAVIAYILSHVRGMLVWTRVAAVGFVCLVVFVVIRAASFHHMDQFLGSSLAGVKVNWVMELFPLAVISYAAHAWRSRRSLNKSGSESHRGRRDRH